MKKLCLERDNYECIFCSSKDNIEVHHLLPMSFYGNNNLNNLQTLCRWCHRKIHILLNQYFNYLYNNNLLKTYLLNYIRKAEFYNYSVPYDYNKKPHIIRNRKGSGIIIKNINFRCPDILKEVIQKVSVKKDRSLSYMIVKILEDHVGKY